MNGTAGGSKTTLYVKDATSPEVSFVITKTIELDLPIKIKSNINTEGNDNIKYCYDI